MDDMDYQKKPLKDWRVLLYITTAFSFLGGLGESAFLARDHLFTVITPWFIDACAPFRRGAARHTRLWGESWTRVCWRLTMRPSPGA